MHNLIFYCPKDTFFMHTILIFFYPDGKRNYKKVQIEKSCNLKLFSSNITKSGVQISQFAKLAMQSKQKSFTKKINAISFAKNIFFHLNNAALFFLKKWKIYLNYFLLKKFYSVYLFFIVKFSVHFFQNFFSVKFFNAFFILQALYHTSILPSTKL